MKSTEEYGPYYILSPGIAMPHARPDEAVKENAFSLVTFKNPIKLGELEGEYAQIFIVFSATNSETHVGQVIPQIVDIFDEEENYDKIIGAMSVEELLEYI